MEKAAKSEDETLTLQIMKDQCTWSFEATKFYNFSVYAKFFFIRVKLKVHLNGSVRRLNYNLEIN